MASEEQKKDLQTKITVALVVLIVGGAIYGIGPGLSRFVDHARSHKSEPWAPKWYYNIGRVYEATWREKDALKVYQEFYTLWSGDESKYDFVTVQEQAKQELDSPALVPMWAAPGREPLGGPGAQPHPLMADVLMRLCQIEENRRDYQTARWYYTCVLVIFPQSLNPQAYARAEAAHKRDLSRSF